MDELTKLKDIKPPVNIDTFWQEFAIYAGAVFGLLLLSIGIVLIYLLVFKRRKRHKRLSPKELALKALNELDFKNTKDAVYNFSINAQTLANSGQQGKLEDILNSLEKYKYKKEVDSLSSSDIKVMQNFIKELKVEK